MEDVCTLVDRISSRIQKLPRPNGRTLIAIGGPPASGKSTLAELLQERLNEQSMPCGLVPMDGFHLDNEVLNIRGLLPRKGAPETFDVEAFRDLIHRLTIEQNLSVPLFDRERDCVIADASCVKGQHHYVIVEGNYLFLNIGAWKKLQSYWSLRIFIAPPQDVLEQRLVKRWLAHGLDEPSARARTVTNDLPNAELITTQSDIKNVDMLLE